MQPIVKEASVHRLNTIPPNGDTTFIATDEQHASPDGEQFNIKTAQRFTDAHGLQIMDNSLLVCCGVTGQIVAVIHAFCCIDCRKLCSSATLAKRANSDYIAKNPLNHVPMAAPVVGFCSKCWAKPRIRVLYRLAMLWRLAGLFVRELLRPIIALGDRPAVDPVHSTPVVVIQAQPPKSQPLDPEESGEEAAESPRQQERKTKPAKAAAVMLLLAFLNTTTMEAQAMNNLGPASASQMEALFKRTAGALESADRLGLRDNNRFPVAFGLCAVLDFKLRRGEIDKFRLDALLPLIEKRTRDVRDLVLAFEQPDPDELLDGDLLFMRTYPKGAPVLYPSSEMPRGLSMKSNTGMGKSSLFLSLADVWRKLARAAVILARKPDGFFSRLVKMRAQPLLWLRVGEPFFNPFCNPAANARETEILRSSFERWDSGAVFQKLLDDFFSTQHLHRQAAPTLPWMLKALPNLALNKDLYNPHLRASLYAVLDSMSRGLLGRTLAADRLINLSALIKHGITLLLDCHGLDDAEYVFFASSLLHHLRLAKEADPSAPPVLVEVDEAGVPNSRRWDQGTHVGPWASEIPLCRSAGIAVAHASHNASQDHPLVSSNNGLSIIGAVNNAGDYVAAGATVALEQERCTLVSQLPKFVGIAKFTGPGYSKPFIVQWDQYFNIPILSEEERLRNNNDVLNTFPDLLLKSAGNPAQSSFHSESPSVCPENDIIILTDLYQRPFVATVERAASVTLSDGKHPEYTVLTTRLESMCAAGYCFMLTVRMLTGRGGSSKYWPLTAKGYAAINQPAPQFRQGTGYRHIWAQQFIQHLLHERGIKADIEPRRGKAEPDLGFVLGSPEKSVAVEIVLSTHRYEFSKIATTLTEWDYLLLLALDTKDRNTLETAIRDGYAATGRPVDANVTICYPAHLQQTDIMSLCNCPDLVFGSKSKKKGKRS